MKKVILLVIVGLISASLFGQIEKREFYLASEAKNILENNFEKNNHLMYSEESFLRSIYISYSKDTVTTYEIFDQSFSDNGFAISYSDEFIDFEGAYESREIFRGQYCKECSKHYTGVFKMKPGSEYDEIIVSTESVTRDPDMPNFKNPYSIAFKKGNKIHVSHIFNPGRDYLTIE